MMSWEKGMAFFECRYYKLAGNLFAKAYQQEPKFTESLVNAAQASLMDYYDSLPKGVQDKWFIPDFGPVLSDNPIAGNRGDDFTDDDRNRFKLAMHRRNCVGDLLNLLKPEQARRFLQCSKSS